MFLKIIRRNIINIFSFTEFQVYRVVFSHSFKLWKILLWSEHAASLSKRFTQYKYNIDLQKFLELVEGGFVSPSPIHEVFDLKFCSVYGRCCFFPNLTNQNKYQKYMFTYLVTFSFWRKIDNPTKHVHSASSTFRKSWVNMLRKIPSLSTFDMPIICICLIPFKMLLYKEMLVCRWKKQQISDWHNFLYLNLFQNFSEIMNLLLY